MDYKIFINDIKTGETSKLYLFYGNERYLMDKALEKLKEKYIDSINENFNYVYYQEFKGDIDELMDSCETLPFMGEKRIVIVDNEDFFSNKKNVLNKDDEDKLIKYFSNISDTTCLIFLGGNNIDNRRKIVKQIGKYGKVLEFRKLKKEELVKWIVKVLKTNKKIIEYNTLEILIDILGYLENNSKKTLYDIENELKKICNFIAEKTVLELDDIKKIISKPMENNIFELVDAVGEKNGSRALKIFSNMLISSEPEVRILHMIIRQFKILYLVKLMVDRGYTTISIAPKLSLPQYIVKKYVKQANIFSCKDLLNVLNKGLEADKNIKTGKMTPRLAIEILITECCEI